MLPYEIEEMALAQYFPSKKHVWIGNKSNMKKYILLPIITCDYESVTIQCFNRFTKTSITSSCVIHHACMRLMKEFLLQERMCKCVGVNTANFFFRQLKKTE